jgi:hypothetical protein
MSFVVRFELGDDAGGEALDRSGGRSSGTILILHVNIETAGLG